MKNQKKGHSNTMLDYKDRKSWEKKKDGTYISKDRHGGQPRFAVRKTQDMVRGNCWQLNDLVTGRKVFENSFEECRDAATRISKEISQRIPEEYFVGMTAYTGSGHEVTIESIGEKGYGCWYTYQRGPRKGKRGYIAEVNWLFVGKSEEGEECRNG